MNDQIRYENATLPTQEESRQRIKEWVDALRSGKYNQAQGYLRTAEGFCCLGVACHVVNPIPWEVSHINIGGCTHYGYEHPDYTAILPKHIAQFYGMGNNSSAYTSIRDRDGELIELAGLNDEGFPFSQIADLIAAGLLLDHHPKDDELYDTNSVDPDWDGPPHYGRQSGTFE